MSLSLFQIIVAAIAVIYLMQCISRFIRRETFQSYLKFLVVFGVWSGVLFLALFPPMARVISEALGLGQNLNTLIFAAFIAVFLFLFRILALIEKIESEITVIVREQAIDQLKDEA